MGIDFKYFMKFTNGFVNASVSLVKDAKVEVGISMGRFLEEYLVVFFL